jgi:hypothetical protein
MPPARRAAPFDRRDTAFGVNIIPRFATAEHVAVCS